MALPLYPIEQLPPKAETLPLNIERVRASLAALQVGEGFVIPAAELADKDGRFRSTPIGQRIHRLAGEFKMRITTKKLAAGLRVRRES